MEQRGPLKGARGRQFEATVVASGEGVAAAFRGRHEACAKWESAKAGEVAIDGGWGVYSSSPVVYIALAAQHALGVRRRFGKRTSMRTRPPAHRRLRLAGVPPADRRPPAIARRPLRRRADREARP
jgi:hypothetical protein